MKDKEKRQMYSTLKGRFSALKDLDTNTDYKSTTLNVFPDELTITELDTPEAEDTLSKATSVGVHSRVYDSKCHNKRNKTIFTSPGEKTKDSSGLRYKLNDFYTQRVYESPKGNFYKDDQIVIQEFHGEGTEQDDAKIIETEEAEENDLVIHRNKSNNEISSIDLTNGLGEISDFTSTDNMMNMLPSNDNSYKRYSFTNATELSPSVKFEYDKSGSKQKIKISHEGAQRKKHSVCLPNMLFFRK
jgi:hypothetical protein